MAGLSNITNIWNTVKEIDLRPVQQEALNMVRIAIAGAPGSGRAALATQMRRDPSRPDIELQTPLLILDLESPQQAIDADLIILIVNAQTEDFSREKTAIRHWANAGKKGLVIINQPASPPSPRQAGPWIEWGQNRVLFGPVEDPAFLLNEFVPTVMNLLPGNLLSLGRYFPLFRVPIAHRLINDTSFSNAAYSISTGLAEIVPVLGIPLNVTDMVVLSKNQAFLVYKLGLALGLSTNWQDYVAEFGSVLGGGFLWRQLARSLIGLIPAWGIIPKVAIAYAGTYVVGNVVLQWYLTGRHVSAKQIQAMYREAFQVGKRVAANLVDKVPRPRLGRRRQAALPAPTEVVLELGPEEETPAELMPAEVEPEPGTNEAQPGRVCPNCGRTSAPDARFCQYCGQDFAPVAG